MPATPHETANPNPTTRKKTPSQESPGAPSAGSLGPDTRRTPEGRLRRFYLLSQKIKQLEDERAALRGEIVSAHGTGTHSIGHWLANIVSFDQRRFDRAAAEAELGSLERFEKATPTLRVDVKPKPSAILEAMG